MTAQPIRILCIEDNPVNWRLVQRLLTQAGYEMHWAADGMKGFEMALALKPALILLDINLPGLSGFEVATKFRQNQDLQNIPMVALTAKTLKSDRETALVAGCDGFIPKPLDPFTFVGQVGAYLAGAREFLETSQEKDALRHFNRHVLEHLESQLKEAQEANKKLLAAQEALEARNRSLARLLALSQSILTEHDPHALLQRVLDEVRAELRATGLWSYRIHPSGGYFEGLRWNGRFEPTPVLPLDHPFVLRARALPQGGPLRGEGLRSDRVWDEGLGLGFWSPASEACMLVLRDHQTDPELFGFWIITRSADQRLLPAELEMVSLHASIAMVSLENAELIATLNNSTRALASSYEKIEAAYQDLQNAREVLGRRDRQELLGDLIFKIAQRLEAPVASLHRQSQLLDQLMAPGAARDPAVIPEAQPKALAEIREAVFRIDSLLKALLRRVGRGGPPTPEWLDLHDLLQQELGLLQVEGVIPAHVVPTLDLAASSPLLHGVYGDFAATLLNVVQHALGGPTPSATLVVTTSQEGEDFILELRDEGGPILPSELAQAFEPFSELHQQVVIGGRSPGEGLAGCKQLLAVYHGEISIANEGEGTVVRVRIPLH
ncbi:MAG: hybrid sensor histidine kinase/response regulator [Holophaga sp.]|nr:hybrid sensor histidine kinase/response regulator [Holophaga sp.]